MGEVYRRLNEPLKNRLESTPCSASSFLISSVATRYEISEEKLEAKLKDQGYLTEEIAGNRNIKRLKNFKQNIFLDSDTGMKSIAVNLSGSLPGLDKKLLDYFQENFKTPK